VEPFVRLDAVALLMPVPSVDTDQIIPARFLRKSRNDGFGQYLFHDLRFDDAGREKPDFVLNQPSYRGARVLVADRNFGYGSSREHAVYALWDYGFRAAIAPSFGDIFMETASRMGFCPLSCRPENAGAD
jgi:3-isopropylmalate/(R)-2-methylmalate dehydratase small subunit